MSNEKVLVDDRAREDLRVVADGMWTEKLKDRACAVEMAVLSATRLGEIANALEAGAAPTLETVRQLRMGAETLEACKAHLAATAMEATRAPG
jgi:hypothetical protein